MNYPDDYVNKIICGDCFEIMKKMPDKCVDLILTDPPYNVKINYGAYKDNLSSKSYLEIVNQTVKEFKRISDNKIVTVLGSKGEILMPW